MFKTMVLFGAAFSTALAHASAKYVSVTGNDTNIGSLAAPYRTIQHAVTVSRPGDTVYVRAGSYHELVTFPGSGSATLGPITLQNYPGETAVLDGSGLPVPGGQSGMINITSRSYITISGLLIRNYTTTSNRNTPLGIYVSGSGSNIQILNNRITNISNTGPSNQCGGSSPNAFGIAVYGTRSNAPISQLTVSGNQLDHLKTGCSESLVVNGNVQYWSITNNSVHDNNNIGIDAIGYEGSAPVGTFCGADLCDRARDGLISGNTVYNISSFYNPAYAGSYSADGIYVDGGTRIVIERNRIYHTDIGIEVASENPGNQIPGVENSSYVTVRNNLIYWNYSVGVSIGGYDNTRGGTAFCNIVNNTLFQNDTMQTGSGEFQVQYFSSHNVFANNILFTNSQGLFVNSYTRSTQAPITADYNVFFSGSSSVPSVFVWGGHTYVGLLQYRTASNEDLHSLASDPKFVLLTTPNLNLQLGSPALNTGEMLSGTVGTSDYAGNSRTRNNTIDIGAYED